MRKLRFASNGSGEVMLPLQSKSVPQYSGIKTALEQVLIKQNFDLS